MHLRDVSEPNAPDHGWTRLEIYVKPDELTFLPDFDKNHGSPDQNLYHLFHMCPQFVGDQNQGNRRERQFLFFSVGLM